MSELPLFPLQTVLFPGMPLYLHIFEDRYKRMIRLCLENRQPFGVVLIRRGVEALGPLAETHPVGCLARIVEVQNMSEGRLNITAAGEERFRILSVHSDITPYLIGEVELEPLVIPERLAFQQAVHRLQPVVARYLQILAESGGSKIELRSFPAEPLAFIYTAAMVLQAPPVVKQELLELAEGLALVERLQALYRRETALLRAMLAFPQTGGEKTFSKN